MSSPFPLTELKAAARATWPERPLRRFRVHDRGWANFVLEADNEIMFRFPRRRAVAESLDFEVRALDLLARHLSTPVPVPARISVLRKPRGWPFIAYRKLPGKPLSDGGPTDAVGRRRLDSFVGTLLSELAAMPAGSLRRIGAEPGSPPAWEQSYRELQQRFRRSGESQVPPPVRSSIARAFDRFYRDLRTARYRPVATHRDLGPDHILWDSVSNRPGGVIDWEDLCLGDPAFDLTGLDDFAPARLREWTRARQGPEDSTFDARLWFYRRVRPIHGVLHAVETGDPRWLRRFLPQLCRGFPG
jgi:aminoglycoside 2''-phosphotransferase